MCYLPSRDGPGGFFDGRFKTLYIMKRKIIKFTSDARLYCVVAAALCAESLALCLSFVALGFVCQFALWKMCERYRV